MFKYKGGKLDECYWKNYFLDEWSSRVRKSGVRVRRVNEDWLKFWIKMYVNWNRILKIKRKINWIIWKKILLV